MDKSKLKEIQQKIEQEIKKTAGIIEEYKEMTQPIAPENAIGRLSRMDAINNKSVTEAALRQAENKLQKLNEVLEKIGEKDFGLCAKCWQQIPLGRIMLMPQSRYCVNCAQ